MRCLQSLVISLMVLALIAAPVSAHSSLPDQVSSQPDTALKAVLIAGSLDGDMNSKNEKGLIDSLELAAAVLEANGVTVHRFYTPNDDWEDIRAAAQGAHFLLYRGHGVYDGTLPVPKWVGGFGLTGGVVRPEQIRDELRLAPNAIVMLYGCFTAGSAGNDTSPIDLNEAIRRVSMYSDPFFDLGAGGYYANWFGDAFAEYLKSLFQGSTLGQAYQGYHDFNAKTAHRMAHPDHPVLNLWLDYNDWDTRVYSNAFAGHTDLTLADLFPEAFGGPAMELSRQQIVLLAETSDDVRTLTVDIRSTNGKPFTWKASADAKGWLSLNPTSGTSGETLRVVIDPPAQPGRYSATVTIEAGPGVENSIQRLPVEVIVAEELSHLFIPLASK